MLMSNDVNGGLVLLLCSGGQCLLLLLLLDFILAFVWSLFAKGPESLFIV